MPSREEMRESGVFSRGTLLLVGLVVAGVVALPFVLTALPIAALPAGPETSREERTEPAAEARTSGAPASPAPDPAGDAGTRTVSLYGPYGSAPGEDPLATIVSRLQAGDFRWQGDLTTGRFLAEFETAAVEIDNVDMRGMRVKRRGNGWVVVEARYRSRKGEEGKAILRFVDEDGWRIEDLDIVLERTDADRF